MLSGVEQERNGTAGGANQAPTASGRFESRKPICDSNASARALAWFAPCDVFAAACSALAASAPTLTPGAVVMGADRSAHRHQRVDASVARQARARRTSHRAAAPAQGN